MNRRMAGIALGTVMVFTLSGSNVIPQGHRAVREEAQEHPRIAAAISQLEDAIAYLESSREDFGGHKAAALRASREAVKELRQALKYRARKER